MSSNKQSHPSLQDNRFTIRIKKNGDVNAGSFVVKAPLPENWGFTIGSEFSAPFDANFVSGAASKMLAMGGVSSKLGVATKKLYSNPEPTEISFDMQFEAYEDAKNDVLVPIIVLMSMAIGSKLSLEDAANEVESLVNQFSSNIGRGQAFSPGSLASSIDDSSVGQAGSKAFDFLTFVQGPPTVTLRFGSVIKFRNTYITSVAPSFSNILDKEGTPMSATVSVTAILELDPIMDDENFKDFFALAGGEA